MFAATLSAVQTGMLIGFQAYREMAAANLIRGAASALLADRWETIHPKAVACQCAHLVDLLTAIVIRASNSARRSASPTRSMCLFPRGPKAHRPDGHSRTRLPWIASCSPSPSTKTATRASPPLRPDTNLSTLPPCRWRRVAVGSGGGDGFPRDRVALVSGLLVHAPLGKGTDTNRVGRSKEKSPVLIGPGTQRI